VPQSWMIIIAAAGTTTAVAFASASCGWNATRPGVAGRLVSTVVMMVVKFAPAVMLQGLQLPAFAAQFCGLPATGFGAEVASGGLWSVAGAHLGVVDLRAISTQVTARQSWWSVQTN